MIKKLLPGTMITLVLGLLLAGIFFKDKLNGYVSKIATPKDISGSMNPEAAFIDAVFNYAKNGQDYHLTFLEFGSTSCSGCKKMEKVMQMVKDNYPGKVNVVFYNVNLEGNFKMAEHFGIRMIPVQVLLDKNGREYFRHIGYLSFNELAEEIDH